MMMMKKKKKKRFVCWNMCDLQTLSPSAVSPIPLLHHYTTESWTRPVCGHENSKSFVPSLPMLAGPGGGCWGWSGRSAAPLSGGVLEISSVQDPGPICQRDAPTESKCWTQAGEPSAPPKKVPLHLHGLQHTGGLDLTAPLLHHFHWCCCCFSS